MSLYTWYWIFLWAYEKDWRIVKCSDRLATLCIDSIFKSSGFSVNFILFNFFKCMAKLSYMHIILQIKETELCQGRLPRYLGCLYNWSKLFNVWFRNYDYSGICWHCLFHSILINIHIFFLWDIKLLLRRNILRCWWNQLMHAFEWIVFHNFVNRISSIFW